MTKSTKKVSNTKNYIILAAMGGLITWMLLPEDNEDSYTPVTKTISKTEEVKEQSYANVPERFNSAPSYNALVMQLKINQQAIDMGEAEHFTKLKVSARNLKLKKDIAESQAVIAQKNLEAKKANNAATKIGSGQDYTSTYNEENEYPLLSEPNNSPSIPNPDGSINIETQNQNRPDYITIVGWSVDGSITASINDKYYADDIQEGQVLWGRYRVKEIKTPLKCLKLKDDRVGKDIPDVCYN
mgnify:CR=1 FL=1